MPARLVLPLLTLFAALPALGQELPASLDEWLERSSTERRIERQLSLNHIGIAVARQENRRLISAVLDNSPAFAAGLRRGDELLAVNGAPYQQILSLNSAPAAESSPAESPFRLRISRGGAERELAVTPVFNNLFDSYRSAVEASVQQFNMGNKLIGYVRLWGISGNANDLVTLTRIMADFRGTDSLILDLRNAAGYLGNEHLALFLPGEFGDWYSNPLTLIIDDSTAGSAEAFAAELARFERVTSVGAAAAGGLQPELPVAWPLDSDSPGDPQFEAALALLAGLF